MATRIKRNGKVKRVKPLEVKGEESIGGSAPTPESDDNALEAAQRAGLYLKASESRPVRVGLGEQINKAERRRRTAAITDRKNPVRGKPEPGVNTRQTGRKRTGKRRFGKD